MDVAFENGLSPPGMVVGDGTVPYPGISMELDGPENTEKVKETPLGRPRPFVERMTVPRTGTSGLLDTLSNPADGCVRE